MKQKNLDRLHIKLDPKTKRELRILAAKRNITMTSLVKYALMKYIDWEKKYE
jgi:predicted transcriptional regulator